MIFRNAAPILLMLIAAFPTLSHADVLPIHGVERIEVPKETDAKASEGFRSAVSRKNLLGASRKSPLSLPDIALSTADVVDINICAIRVQFQKEEPDDPNTTGLGQFDMRSQEDFMKEERHPIDMSPHGRTYFESHLRALHEYWNVVSQGRVNLTYSVFPSEEDSVYTLSNQMGHYGAQPPEFGLGEFFVESFQIADGDTAIHFDEFDVFVVFHAGVDQQNDIGYPPTPYDLYTGFILLGPTLIVDDSIRITEGVMMPEAASQDNRVIALNGVFAHEFGHQLGLVDLYDTRTWMTQVGDFSLHDNQGRGTAADLGFERSRLVSDVLPVFPDAWSRAYLGFAEVHEVSDVRNQEVWAAELETDQPQILKIPISDHEYYLIENRQIDSDRDDSTNLRIDSLTGVILGPAPTDTVVDKRYLTRDYDFFLPGSGILIWHVDETRAYLDYTNNGQSNFLDNTLQWYNFYPCLIPNEFDVCIDSIQWENRRFLSVVEADGIVDFGGNYRTGFGTQEDYFYRGHNDAFGPTTNPSSRSNSGAYTGIRIYDISAIDTIMTVSVQYQSKVEGFPRFVNNSNFPPVLVHLDRDDERDGNEEIFISGEKHIIAMYADGSPIIAPLPGEEIFDSTFVLYSDTASGGLGDVIAPDGSVLKGGSYIVDTLRSIASVGEGETITTPPLVVDVDNDGIFEVAVGTDQGKVHIWKIADDDADGQADSMSVFQSSGDRIIAGPVALSRSSGGSYMFFSDGDSVVRWDGEQDSPTWTNGLRDVSHFSVDDDADEVYLVALKDGSEASYVLMRFGRIGEFLYDLGEVDVVGFTAADLDGEYGTDFVLTTSDGKLIILLSESLDNDSYSANEIQVEDSLSGGVVTAALDRTVAHYQIMFVGENRLHVYNHSGTQFDNFPQRVDVHRPVGLISSTPVVADADGDGGPDIIVGTDAGEVFAFGSDGTLLGQFPRFVGSGACLSYAVSEGALVNSYKGKLFAIGDDNRMYGLHVESQPLADEESWRQSGRSALHQNFRGSSGVEPETPGGLIADFYNYPNPASNHTNIRYRLTKDGNVKLQIFDLSGRLIYEDQATGENISRDYEWNLDGYPSGVYICRLEASSGGSSEVQTHKIAVVK
jgi:M6 family metalloprotease-like protein